MSLQGKVVVITGGSKGIGRACVERAAHEGASVVINYNSDAAPAHALVSAIGADRALAVQADVSKLADMEKLVCATVAKFGAIDVLVPNAGVMPMRTVLDTSEADFDQTFNLNVKGPYFLVQKAVPHMAPGARVILVSTGICHLSSVAPNYLLYAASKGAVEQMTRVMAKDLGRRGILVNAVAPGPTATDLFFKGKPDHVVDMLKGANPFNRLGQPDEVAAMVAFLAGRDSSWVAGQTLLVNGGMMV